MLNIHYNHTQTLNIFIVEQIFNILLIFLECFMNISKSYCKWKSF